MTQTVRELLHAIERPLRYIEKGDTRKLHSVKNLSVHILNVSRQALSASLGNQETHLFRSLQELFFGYETLADSEKQLRVLKALELISPSTQKRTPKSFRPDEHPSPTRQRMEKGLEKLRARVQYIKGVGPAMAGKLEKAGILTVEDLLYFFPHRYEDRKTISRVGDLKDGDPATVIGAVLFSGVAFYRGLRKRVFEVTLEDGSGELKLKWFRFPMGSLEERIKRGSKLVVCGKVKSYRSTLEMHHPDFEVLQGEIDSISFGRIVPVYREVGGLYQKRLRKALHTAVVNFAAEKACALPPDVCRALDLQPPSRALKELHFPDAMPIPERRNVSQKTLAFEELFFYSLSLLLRKRNLKKETGFSFDRKSPRMEKLIQELPFRLTEAQKRVLAATIQDMASPHPMNRLLQGDVGSGKTVVSFLAALLAIDHGRQVALMAPTEILAEQHAQTFTTWSKMLDVRVASLIGRQPISIKKEIVDRLKKGDIDLLIGTHALLEEQVAFRSLGLVIVDEQHRFGVAQRASLRTKGLEPDVLVMSATPIPRTLALTLYGDLDVSILDELPQGRKPIETKVNYEKERDKVYAKIRDEIKKGRQAYIVYPLIDASDKLQVKDATSMAKTLSEKIFHDFRVELIHGQLKGEEKDRLMNEFHQGKIQILVSTTVIEVGIDVSNATMMVIEHPERFGLSQLHQLRGRVGRGCEKSFCYLLCPPNMSALSRERLSIFSRIHDGFLLAEEDLRMRGPGDFFGVEQTGFPPFAVAQFPRDIDLLESARREANALLERDPYLKEEGHSHLPWLLNESWSQRLRLVRIG